MLTYDFIKDRPRELLAMTGLTHEEFTRLIPAFTDAYADLYPPNKTQAGKPRQRRVGAGAKGALAQITDKLLFILVYQKTQALQTLHGLQFGLSQPQANYWIHRLTAVLQRALAALGHAPERDASQVADSPLAVEGAPTLAIDGTERRRQRPQDPARQKAHYSGKQKAHTDKNLVLVNEVTGQVVYLGPTLPGKTHDKRAADEACIAYPPHATLDKDTGFQGYEPPGVLTQQPKKKPKGKALSPGQRALNRIFSSARVVVEHAIAGIKRCRIVKEVLRLTKAGISDRVMEIACGLHNLRVSCRHPLPTLDLLSLAGSS